MSTYCVMQPYFFPYQGYYELMKRTDYFVIFDNAQFPRRGRVHRCEITDKKENKIWLTLNIERAAQTEYISAIKLDRNFSTILQERFNKFPRLRQNYLANPELEEILFSPDRNLLGYLEKQLSYIAKVNSFKCKFVRASEIYPRNSLDYQEYICEIGHSLNSKKYINLSGGKSLYSFDFFKDRDINLEFLENFNGAMTSILENKIIF